MRRMNRFFLFLLLTVLALLLSGCTDSHQVENQAFVIVLGVDRGESGALRLTVQLPKISNGQDTGGESGSGGSSGKYFPLSVEAQDYEHALERLSWAVPRDMNLSQIKMIAISEDLAREEGCRELLFDIAKTERLFTAAELVVCEGSAKDFVSALTPLLGTRLSTDIESTLDHYLGLGIIPDASLANLNYLNHSVYSDPLTAYALLEKDKAVPTASALSGSLDEISNSFESEFPTRYLGAAIFVDGRLQGIFSGDQAILTNLITDTLHSFRYICSGESLEFSPIGNTDIAVDTSAEPVRIRLKIRLAISMQQDMPPDAEIIETLTRDMHKVIAYAQELGAEPFGFANAAARNFLTLKEWQAYDWRSHFRDAEIEIKLSVSHADA